MFVSLYTPGSRRCELYTVDTVIFECLRFREFVILGHFTKSRIRELLILMTGGAQNNNFRKIPKFANLSCSRNSRKLKLREYYQIYSIQGGRGIGDAGTLVSRNPVYCLRYIQQPYKARYRRVGTRSHS